MGRFMTPSFRSYAAFAVVLASALAGSACANDTDAAAPIDAESQSEALVTAPKVLAAEQVAPGELALDASHVYWTAYGSDAGDGRIVRVSKSGGTPFILARRQSVPFGIAVDDTQVYWVNYDAGGANGALMAVAKTGGTPKALVTTPDGPRTVVVDAANAYFLTSNAVVKVAKHGGAPSNVTSTQCGSAIAADDANLYWVVNCVMFPPQGIFKVAKTGGTAVKISDEAPSKLVVQSDGLYFMAAGGNVMRLSKLGGIGVPVAKFDLEWSGPLAVDALGFYAGVDTSIVKRSRYSGLLSRTLATTPLSVGTLAVDGAYVYWTASGQGDGQILRTSKL
jgi:hypothetical protein